MDFIGILLCIVLLAGAGYCCLEFFNDQYDEDGWWEDHMPPGYDEGEDHE